MLRLRFCLLILLSATVACSRQEPVSKSQDQYSGVKFYYFDIKDRQKIISDLKEMVLDNYVLLSVKQARGIVTNPVTLFDAAISAENDFGNFSDTLEFDQAKGNLDFLDRVAMLIATFQDTHFSVSTLVARATILNGIQLNRLGNEVVITRVRDKVMSFIKSEASDPSAYDQLKAGVKAISIDGVPVNSIVGDLRKYISASTPSFADIRGVAALSQRSFSLPNRGFSDWEFMAEDGHTFKLRLPYFYATKDVNAVRKDEKAYFEGIGIKPISDLTLDFDDAKGNWTYARSIGVTGFSPTDVPHNLVDVVTWFNSASPAGPGNEVLRTGYMIKSGKAYGVLQVFGFSASEVKTSDSSKSEKFIAPIQQFIKQLKADDVPLILDLRKNGGGDPLNAIALLSAIAKTGETYPSTTRALRVTRIIRQMVDQGDFSKLPDLNTYSYDQTAQEELRKAVSSRAEYTSAFTLTPDVTADSVVGGYDKKIVALMTPNCISACDGMAILLKGANRAILVGTTTNGTGAGFIGSGAFEDVQWRDRYQLLSIRVPNRLFGYGGPVGQSVFSEADAFIKMNSENRPVAADVTYDNTLPDFLVHSSGWYGRAIDLLNQNN